VDKNLHFSISHTKNHAFCCVSDVNVGLDAEEIDRRVSPALADKILSPREKRRCAADAAILRLWVLKEAYAKLTGKGLATTYMKPILTPAIPGF